MNNISIIKECSNCGACVCACPMKAITVVEDYYFKIKVNEDKCVLCGKCLSTCPIDNLKAGNEPCKAIGGWANQKDVREKSSSGGVFSLLAEYVLSREGVVFGARYAEDCRKIVFDSTDYVSLDALRRSKYVESDTGESFIQVQNHLKSGRLVLFCGTPCQVAGLSSFLGKQYDNLILCDFACGGLPSHKIFSDYIEELEERYKAKVVSVNFRPKVSGWSRHHILIRFANGIQYSRLAMCDPFFYSFVYGRVSIRENCYDCKFSNNHYSDITLADYWKYADTPEIVNDEKGISLVIANTIKGKVAVEKILDKMQYYELDLQKASYNFKNTVRSEQIVTDRKRFFSVLRTKGLTEAAKACGMLHGVKATIFLTKLKIGMVLSSWKRK